MIRARAPLEARNHRPLHRSEPDRPTTNARKDAADDHPEHIDQLPAELFPTLPVCWATMTDLETEDALDELQDWVVWVVDRYALDHRIVPPCWDNHGALIEELSALRTAWVAAFCITGRPEAPLEWHRLPVRPANDSRTGRRAPDAARASTDLIGKCHAGPEGGQHPGEHQGQAPATADRMGLTPRERDEPHPCTWPSVVTRASPAC